jgi:site-specific DNA-cytosine methylase
MQSFADKANPPPFSYGMIIDNFAGAGGASTGIEIALERSPDIAINHDHEALAMHEANHPETLHLCESVWDVDIAKQVAGGMSLWDGSLRTASISQKQRAASRSRRTSAVSRGSSSNGLALQSRMSSS